MFTVISHNLIYFDLNRELI